MDTKLVLNCVFEVPGKIALWLEDESKGQDFGTEDGDTIDLRYLRLMRKNLLLYSCLCKIPMT